jgi:hypothetical protein
MASSFFSPHRNFYFPFLILGVSFFSSSWLSGPGLLPKNSGERAGASSASHYYHLSSAIIILGSMEEKLPARQYGR